MNSTAEQGNKVSVGSTREEHTKLDTTIGSTKFQCIESKPEIEPKEESFRVPPLKFDPGVTCITSLPFSSCLSDAECQKQPEGKRDDVSRRLHQSSSVRSLVSAASTGSNASRLEDNDPITESSLRKFAILLLLVQALVSAGSLWYTLLIGNPMVITSVFTTFELWCCLLSWKLMLLHPSHHTLVYTCSVVIAFCCAVLPMILQFGLFWWFSVPFVISLALQVWALHLTKVYLWDTNTTEELQDLALTTIGSSLKAGIVLVYFQAESLAAIAAQSSEELLEAVACYDWYEGRIWFDDSVYDSCDGALSSNEADQRMAHQNYQELAEQVLDYLRATVSGCTINISVYLWLVFLHVLHLSLNDVLALRVTVSEGVLQVASLLLVALCLIFQSTPNVLLVGLDDLLLVVTVFTIFVSAVYLVRKVVKDAHPYHQSRLEAKRRGQSSSHEQIPFASSDVGPA